MVEYWIRKATDHDMPLVRAMWLELAAYEAGLSKRFGVKGNAGDLWAEELARDRAASRAEVFVAETAAGALVGFLHVRAVPGAPFHHEDRLGFVDGVWVSPAHRRGGLARRLINAALVWCRERKLTLLEAGVVTANKTAMEAWRHIGFEMTSAVMTYPVAKGPLAEVPSSEPTRVAPAQARFVAFARLEPGTRILVAGPAGLAAACREAKTEVFEVSPEDAADGRLPDETFRAIVVSGVLSLSSKPETTLLHLAKHLAPSGALVVDEQVGNEDAERARRHDAFERLRASEHRRFASKKDIHSALAAAGLKIDDERPAYESRDLEGWLAERRVRGDPAEQARDVAEKAALRPEEDALGLQMRRVGDALRFDERRLHVRAVKT